LLPRARTSPPPRASPRAGAKPIVAAYTTREANLHASGEGGSQGPLRWPGARAVRWFDTASGPTHPFRQSASAPGSAFSAAAAILPSASYFPPSPAPPSLDPHGTSMFSPTATHRVEWTNKYRRARCCPGDGHVTWKTATSCEQDTLGGAADVGPASGRPVRMRRRC